MTRMESNRHTHTQVLLRVSIALLCATSVSAQTTDARTEGRVRLGPVRLTPAFTVQELGLDTNVFNDESEQSDFTFTVLPKLDAAISFGRWAQLSAMGGSRARLLSSVRERAIGQPSRVTPRCLDAEPYHRVRGAVGPRTAGAGRVLEIDARARHETREINTGADIKLSERVSLGLGAGNAELTFDENATFEDTSLQATLNRRTRSAWASLRRQVTPLTSVAVRVEANTGRFPFSPERNANTLSILPGVEFQPRALVSGTAAVGVRAFRPENAGTGLPEFTGMIAHANLVYTLKGATRFRFSADRDLAYSFSLTEPYYTIDGYGLEIERHLGGRFDVTAGGDWQTYTYRSFVGLEPLPDEPQVNRTRTWSLGAGYRIREARRLSLDGTYRERESNSPQFQPVLRPSAHVEHGIRPMTRLSVLDLARARHRDARDRAAAATGFGTVAERLPDRPGRRLAT